MAAYGLEERTQKTPKYFRLLDPTAFQYADPAVKPNKVPFLSKAPRKTLVNNPLYTHKIYNWGIPERIHNITSLRSTTPRFSYEAFSKKDLEIILCKCGIDNTCECPISDNEPEKELCQSTLKRRIFKGSVPVFDPSVTPKKYVRPVINPPFYDAKVIESTQFYHGCKWSQWSSKRGEKDPEQWPGPADYSMKKEPTHAEICAERVRAHKRKTSRQLRFIEMVQYQNIRENRPGPAHYDVKLPKGTDLNFIGPKSNRFPPAELTKHPGPADYTIRRHFDPFPKPESILHAPLPEPACFGVKGARFVYKEEERPSPASYTAVYKHEIIHCPTAPFSSSAVRFKPDIIEESEDDEEDTIICPETKTTTCPKPTWPFKSKTIRLKPLVKRLDESSPADLPQSRIKITRCSKHQHIAPFSSSQGRFRPWAGSLPVHGQIDVSHHGFLNLSKPRCPSAFNHGPLYRAERFVDNKFITPAPNEYNVRGGINSVLNTFNQRLSQNVKNKDTFKWTPPYQPKMFTAEQRFHSLLNKSITLLDENIYMPKDRNAPEQQLSVQHKPEGKKKLLRFFLYSHQIRRPD